MVYTVNGVNLTRRKRIGLSGGTSGAQSDYQLKLIAAYEIAMQNDFDDLRFVDTDMQTLIDAWLESKVDSTSANIWVEFPTTPADGVKEKKAYMYFGNAGAASDWDGAATFIQYHGAASENFIDSLVIPASSYVYEVKARCTSTSDLMWGMSNQISWGGQATVIQNHPSSNMVKHQVYNGGLSTVSETPQFIINQWYRGKIIYDGSISHGYWDDNEISTGITTNIPDTTMGLYIRKSSGSGEQDWSFARKYAASPPTYEFGVEEHQRRTPMMM